jgi:hypothetical protein
MKGSFVRERARLFELSVGIGDSEQDIEFLGHCDMRVLMAGNWQDCSYLTIRQLQPIIDFIGRFQSKSEPTGSRHEQALARLYQSSPYEKNVFIMTPFRQDARYRDTIQCIRDALEKKQLKGWLASDLSLNPQLWDNVETFLIGCKFGIAVFTHDDTRKEAGGTDTVFNPNVSIEVGYMLARSKPVLVLKDKNLARLPSDMVGFLYHDFDLDNAPISIQTIVHRWVEDQMN